MVGSAFPYSASVCCTRCKAQTHLHSHRGKRERCEHVWREQLLWLEVTSAPISSTISGQQWLEYHTSKGEQLWNWTSPSTQCFSLSNGIVSHRRNVKKLRVSSGKFCRPHSASTRSRPAH